MRLEGIVTYEYPTQKGTKIKIGTQNAYLPYRFDISLIGSILELEGQWIEKKSKYFYAEKFRILKQFTEEEKEKAFLKVVKTAEKGKYKIPVFFQMGTGKDILAILSQTGRQAVIKKILTSSKKTQTDIIHNPYVLYLKKYSDFYIADILSRRVPTLKVEEKIYPLVLHIMEVAYKNRQESMSVEEVSKKVSAVVGQKIDCNTIVSSIPQKGEVKIDNGNIYLNWVYWCRYYVLNTLSKNCPPAIEEKCDNENISSILSYKYTAVIGPAGSGKTTTIRELMKTCTEPVVLSALTGKAAKVLSENARTVHDLLGFSRERKGKFSKTYINGILVVDESSMLDWVTAHAILRSAKRVIFVGDPDQLPPVHGEAVFKKMLKYLPVLKLTKIHRQKSNYSVQVINRKNYSEMITTAKTLATQFLRQKANFQIITPLVDTAHELNIRIKGEILKRNINDFAPGDRIIVNQNIYVDGILIASNGDTGTVIRKENKQFYRVKIGQNVVMLQKNEMELAYALTVHRAQGSEYEYVIFVVPSGLRKDFFSEEMKYVGESRGRVKTFVVTSSQG